MKFIFLALLMFSSTFVSYAQAQLFDLNTRNESSGDLQPLYLRHKTGYYGRGERLVYDFGSPTYVESMVVSMTARVSFAQARLYVDGKYSSLYGVPGYDPHYPTPIRTVVSQIAIEFEGPIDVSAIELQVKHHHRPQLGFSNPNWESPGDLGDATIRLVQVIQSRLSADVFARYFIPIRIFALRLAAKGAGRPLLSDVTQTEARRLVAAIKLATPTLENLAGYSNDEQTAQIVKSFMYVQNKLQSSYEMLHEDMR